MAISSNATPASPPRVQTRIRIALVGCNHRTAPVELRERVSFSTQQALDAAGELRHKGILEEAVVLSTCNRSELYGVPSEETLAHSTGNAAVVTDAMQEFLTSYHHIPRGQLDSSVYRWVGTDAVRHLFRVAAGLDSMLLGEAEILGQLRTAYNQALDHGSTGPVLNRAFQGALEVGKRVRAETEVGARPMSVALASIKLAERVFGNLKGRSALIVGAGAVAEQVVDHLRNRGIGNLRVVNRSYDRAAELAARMGGEPAEWESLEKVLGAPDIIVTSVSSAAPVLTKSMLDAAVGARSGRPVFVIDLGVPRNVAPEAAGLYNLYLYNIDDLGEIVEQNKRSREAEIPRAESIIAEHLAKFESWRSALEAASIVDDLRDRFHKHREDLLHERFSQLQNLPPEEYQRITSITEELIERVLSQPAQRLRTGPGLRGRLAALETLRHLFDLETNSNPREKGCADEDAKENK